MRTENVKGRWGRFVIEYDVWDKAIHQCKICRETDFTREDIFEHIEEEHDIRERLVKLAEDFDYDLDESRVGSMTDLMNRTTKFERLDALTRKTRERIENPFNESSDSSWSAEEFEVDTFDAEEEVPQYYWNG